MKRLAALSFALFFGMASTEASAQPTQSRVDEVSHSIMMLCTRIEMHGLFSSINASGKRTYPHEVESIETCSNAFQIGRNRVLSAAHVNEDVHAILSRFFVHKLATFQVYGFYPGHNPERVDMVTITRTLISSDGKIYTGKTEKYGAQWQGDVGQETVKTFLTSLVRQPDAAPSTASSLEKLASDKSRDLVLLSISPSRELEAYVSVTLKTHFFGEPVWGVAALLPWKRNGPLNIIITSGKVDAWRDVETTPKARTVISMLQPTKGGFSGGFVVDTFGDLVGVTHASSALEHSWNFDVPHPCSERLPCVRMVVSSESVREFLRESGQ